MRNTGMFFREKRFFRKKDEKKVHFVLVCPQLDMYYKR